MKSLFLFCPPAKREISLPLAPLSSPRFLALSLPNGTVLFARMSYTRSKCKLKINLTYIPVVGILIPNPSPWSSHENCSLHRHNKVPAGHSFETSQQILHSQ